MEKRLMQEETYYISKDHPDMSKLDEVWAHIKTHRTDAKTISFIQSLRQHLKKSGRLSMKQFECMLRCHKATIKRL
jgi:hypothetical protein